MLLATACGEATEPGGVAGAAGAPTGGTGGVGGAPGGAGTGQGGHAWPPATAPACTTAQSDAGFLSVSVSGPRLEGLESLRLRVLERGVGLPPGMASPIDGASTEHWGWLRLRQVTAPVLVDAGASDAGLHDAGASDELERTLVGPAEIGELPVAIGDELTLAREYYNPGKGGSVFDMLREDQERLVLQRDAQVLVFHQRGFALGTHAGMTLSQGDAICATLYSDPPNPAYTDDDYRCAYIYYHALDLTVPGGAIATLMSGQALTVGDYRAFHGTSPVTDYSPRLPQDQSCADLYYFDRATRVTVVLSASP